ncbi:MAG: VOC family protein [Solirubrobacteraceae bacterium]
MPPITPCLWFDGDAEAAVELYTSIFDNSRILRTMRYAEGGRGEAGSVMAVDFELDGQPFMALNGGPGHPFTQAISLQVPCDTQEEIDRYWDALRAGGGQEVVCGWLEDRFGLSWQVFPRRLTELMSDEDPDVARRATEAMLAMKKIDLAAIEAAAAAPA